MKSAAWRRRFMAAAAVTASALAFALYARIQWPWPFIGWIGFVPWLAVLDRTTSARGALGAGLLMCVAIVGIVFGWFASAMQSYTGAPWALAIFLLLICAPLLQPQFITVALARYVVARPSTGFRACERMPRRDAGRAGAPLAPSRLELLQSGTILEGWSIAPSRGVFSPAPKAGPSTGLRTSFWRVALTSACVYVGTEWASPKLFGETVGHGLYPSVLMRQAADIAGAPGLSFVLVMANECVLATLRALFGRGFGRSREISGPRQILAPAGCVAALVVGLLAYGAVRVQQLGGDGRSAGSVAAGVVQADISHYPRLAAEMGTFAAVRMILDTHFALSADALERANLDLLVWPETVYPTTFGAPKSEDGAAFDREIGAFVAAARVPLVFGSYDADGGDEFNAAVFLEPAADGRLTFDTYRKASLFPLTERVPALLDSDAVRRWLPWLGAWTPGGGPQVLPLTLRGGRTVRIAPLICYDAVDPQLAISAVRQGAELIITLSNDSWFAVGPAPHGHLVISAFRSIETRRPQVRSTNTGVSAVIDATGEFLGTLDVHERSILVGTVTPERRAWTLMLAWGDWFGPTALGCGLMLLAAPLRLRDSGVRKAT